MTITSAIYQFAISGLGNVSCKQRDDVLTIAQDLREIYAFDREGRLTGGFLDGKNYRRSMTNAIMQKYFAEDGAKVRRFLAYEERKHLLEDISARVARIREQFSPPEQAELCAWLDRILTWDFDRLEAQREAFYAIYKPVTILPPDQYRALVLQAAEGCSWNRCTFCSFYRDRRFRIKSPPEFQQHARQVKAFLGEAIRLRRSIFLADANALIIPQPRLRELLDLVHAEFPLDRPHAGAGYQLEGIYAFLDIFGAEKKSLADYQELRAYGVRRIYIGLETGDAALFNLLNKPGSPAECIEAVHTIKAAGINVGIILLVGAGGARFARQHIDNSIAAIAAMQPGPGDLIYLSPLIVGADDAYTLRMCDLGIAPLDVGEIDAQFAAIKHGLQSALSHGPKVALYHIEEFIY